MSSVLGACAKGWKCSKYCVQNVASVGMVTAVKSLAKNVSSMDTKVTTGFPILAVSTRIL